MKINLRELTMTAVMLSTTATYAANPTQNQFVSDSDAEYYGESYDEYADNEPISDDAVQQASATAYIGDAATAPTPPTRRVQAASMHVQQTPTYQPAGFRHHHAAQPYMGAACETSCDSGCDGGCDSGCDSCGVRSGMTRMMCGKNPEMWISAEALLWFPQARKSPPLAVVSAAGTAPVLGEPTAETFGEEIGNELTPGFRGDVGRYFADGMFGVGGRVWVLGEDDESRSIESDGTDISIGRPFFNTALGIEDAVIVAAQLPGNANDFVGSIDAQSSLSIVAAEAYGRLNLGSGREVRTELIGGYSYFGIDDDISIRSTSIALSVPGGGTGAETTFRDLFATENNFHGGQIGAETILRRGRWVARSLTKVHMGNMNQLVRIDGSAETTNTLNGPRTLFDNGFLAGAQEGEYERDVFAFAPEVNLKLGYRFREHVTFNVGYTFLYWSRVAMAGQQIDRLVDGGNANPGNPVNPPNFQFADSGFWVQGLDLGATIEF